MTKYHRLSIAFICLIWGTPSLAEPYGFAGCGAGTRIFGPRNWQTSASTTNHGAVNPFRTIVYFPGIPTSQPWSLSFDVAGCDEQAEPIAYFKQYDYTFANFASLSKELAQGAGPTVDGLAAAFGCPDHVHPAFAAHLKSRYETIFAQPGIKAVFIEIRSQLADNPFLVADCKDIIVDESQKVELASETKEGIQ